MLEGAPDPDDPPELALADAVASADDSAGVVVALGLAAVDDAPPVASAT